MSYEDDATRKKMIGAGYRAIRPNEGFSADELQAYRNGCAIYPKRPFPPLVFGFDLVPGHRLPDWCHRDSLEAVAVAGKDGQRTILYRVATNPPQAVREYHAAQAKRASESPLIAPAALAADADETSPEAQRGAA